MCAVSFVSEHYRDKWGLPTVWESVGAMTISYEEWKEYQKLKKRAELYDQQTKQPDCQKPELIEWEQKMEEFLKKKGIL